jgi:hypothetical protein
LLNGCTNPTAEDLVEELFFEDPIDRNMITDFCLEWTPNIRDIASQLTLDANFLLAFK